MSIMEIIQSQYRAALAMLRSVIVQCPDDLWDDNSYANPFWHVAYHALFYAHLYLQPNEDAFALWEKSKQGSHRMDWDGEPYSKAEILEYFEFLREQIERQVPDLNLDAPSGFDWLPMSKLELQFYNIRHIQHHTGELCERLGAVVSMEEPWVGMKAAW
jgi:hypothetical protein